MFQSYIQWRQNMSQPKLLLLFLLNILLLFSLPISNAKSVIEPCKASNPCYSLVSYILPWDSELSEIASRFQVNVSSLLGTNFLDPKTPATQILPKHTVVRVPVSCSCVSGIRRAPVTYTIRAPDTSLESISEGFGGLVSGEQIRSVNSKIKGFIDGRKILVPLPCTCFDNTNNGLPCVYMSYVVGKGEGLSGIAAKYGTTVHELESVNEIAQGNVVPGDILAVPLPACSSAKLDWNNDTLILPNNSYSLRAHDCIICRCGPHDMNLQCSISGIGTSCSQLQCKGSNLFIGQVCETPETIGCNVSRCIYRGYFGDKVFKSLVTKSQIQCLGQNNSCTAIQPITYPPWNSSFNSCTSSSPPTVGIDASTHRGTKDFKHYSSQGLSNSQPNLMLYLINSIFLSYQYFVL